MRIKGDVSLSRCANVDLPYQMSGTWTIDAGYSRAPTLRAKPDP